MQCHPTSDTDTAVAPRCSHQHPGRGWCLRSDHGRTEGDVLHFRLDDSIFVGSMLWNFGEWNGFAELPTLVRCCWFLWANTVIMCTSKKISTHHPTVVGVSNILLCHVGMRISNDHGGRGWGSQPSSGHQLEWSSKLGIMNPFLYIFVAYNSTVLP
jgi:hypothetical protein